MMGRLTRTLVIVGIFGFNSGYVWANDAKWVCTKSGKELKVTGASDDEKKKTCEHQGGAWEKAKAKGTHGDHATKQSAGGGGSW